MVTDIDHFYILMLNQDLPAKTFLKKDLRDNSKSR